VKGYTPLFTKNQLQVVNTDKANLPPASIQYKHVIKEILEKKKFKKAWKYLIWWDGGNKEDATWELEEIILKDTPTLVAAFEKSLLPVKKKVIKKK
jgi:hypothetical protein